MTDPTESGTTAYLVGALVNNEAYGWEFFEQLAAMGTELDSGTSGTHNNVAPAAKVCIAVDYVTQTLESQGSPIKFVYPAEDTIAISARSRAGQAAAQTPTTANCCMTSSFRKRADRADEGGHADPVTALRRKAH